MKKSIALGIGGLLLGAGLIAVAGMYVINVYGAGSASTAAPKEIAASSSVNTAAGTALPRTISVSGSGSIKVTPDIAYIVIGVTTRDAEAKKARADSDARMEKVIAAIKSAGVADKDIQTESYAMYPQYNYDNGVNEINGYQMTNTVRVTVRKVENASDILDKAFEAGANNGGDVMFSITDASPYYEQAVDKAMKDAKDKANAIAKSLNVTVGTPVEIIQGGGAYTPSAYNNYNTKVSEDMSRAGGAAILPGEINISVDLQAVFTY